MNTLILGAGGLLGSHFARSFPRAGHPTVALAHAGLDITDLGAMHAALDAHRPGLVINAAGLVHFDTCEREPGRSESVNLRAPLAWAAACKERGIRFWAFSSDYIFDGTGPHPYREIDPPNPGSVYARHKLALEQGMARFPDHLILRVSWVFGSRGRTFMSLLPGLLASRETLQVAAGKRGSCLYAGDAAEIALRLLERRASGLLNLVNTGETSWERFAHRCRERMQALGLPVRCTAIEEVPYRELPALRGGNRPAVSTLDTTRLEAVAGPIPTWERGLERFLEELRSDPGPRA